MTTILTWTPFAYCRNLTIFSNEGLSTFANCGFFAVNILNCTSSIVQANHSFTKTNFRLQFCKMIGQTYRYTNLHEWLKITRYRIDGWPFTSEFLVCGHFKSIPKAKAIQIKDIINLLRVPFVCPLQHRWSDRSGDRSSPTFELVAEMPW